MVDVNDLGILHNVYYGITLVFAIFIIVFSCVLFYILYKITPKSPEIKILAILNVVEFEMSFSRIVLSIYEFAYGPEVLNKGTILCNVNSFDYQWLMRIELTIVAILSMMRYLIVCHQIQKSFGFWLVITIVACTPASFIYIYPAILNDATPSPSKITCYPYLNRKKYSRIIGCIIPFLFLIPSWVITFCYFAIGLKVNKHLNRMKSEAQCMNDTQSLIAFKRQKIKIFIQLTTVVIIYNLNFSIGYVTWVLKFAIGYNRPPILEALSGVLIFLTLTVNPILTITFQPELNHELVTVLFYLNLKTKRLFTNLF